MNPDLDLEQYIEEGVRLAQFCTGKLDEAERKVEKLIRNQSGKIQTTLFSEEGDES